MASSRRNRSMKGVILAGGLGKRLLPMTLVTNKHLLPVYDRPMIYYPIECLLNIGIDEMLIVTGGDHAEDFLRLLKNGQHLGIRRLRYAYQEGEGGIADALGLAEDFAEGARMCVMLGDNIIQGNVISSAAAYSEQPCGARIVLKQVDDPQRFGVANFMREPGVSPLESVIEKPSSPPSNFAITGIYFYDARVFDIIRTLMPSERNELEITDVNNAYIMDGEMQYDVLRGWWTDAGTVSSLYRAATLVAGTGANSLERDDVELFES